MDIEQGRENGVGFAQGFREVVRHVGVVLLVGVGIATAFTLWTPASVLPRSAARQIARAMATRVGRSTTPLPPTATPVPRERRAAPLTGPLSEMVADLAALRELGVGHLALWPSAGSIELSDYLERIERIATDVVPVLG